MQVLLPWLQEFLPELAIDAKAALDIVARLTASGIECEEPQELAPGVIAIELDLTPNRSDCLSLLGVAREIGALYNLALTYQEAPPLPVRVAPEVITIAAGESCPYYLGLIIDKVQVAPSPLWLQEKLEASGMRPINNVVDLANLVMLELGEPLHTFDYDRLAGGGIHVRYAAPEEEITTLDGVQRRLNRDTLLICDKVKPVAIAGVMGDALSEVTPATQRLLIEAACFERRSIRRTSKEQGLRSEAAIRFEKGVDPAILKKALERYAQLAVSLDLGTPQGKILSATIYGPEATRTILLRHKRLWSITGLPEDNNKAAAMLQRLGFTLTSQDKGWLVTVPTTRQDLHAEIDLIEEVARLIGFAELEAKLPWGVTTPAFYTSRQQALRQIRLCLIRCGLREIVNYSFLHADHRLHSWWAAHGEPQPLIPLQNPLSSVTGVLRTSLLPGMLQVINHNLNQQNPNLQLFELGAVYLPHELPLKEQPQEPMQLLAAFCGNDALAAWNRKPIPLDYFSGKGVLEELAAQLRLDFTLIPWEDSSIYHPYRGVKIVLAGEVVGSLGELQRELLTWCSIDKPVTVLQLALDPLLDKASFLPKVSPLPRYPSALRDLAVLVPLEVTAAELLQVIREAGGSLLEEVYLFDDYRGSQVAPGMKSLAFALTYRSPDSTLTDMEVTTLHQKIVDTVAVKLGGAQR